MSDEPLRVLIFGSRTWNDGGPIQAIIRQYSLVGPTVIIHGAAKGADRLAKRHAEAFGLDVLPFPAKWTEHAEGWCPGDWCLHSGKGFCYAAGPRRNQQMLDEGLPDVAWGFVNKPLATSKGSKDMLDRVRTHGVPWYVLESAA